MLDERTKEYNRKWYSKNAAKRRAVNEANRLRIRTWFKAYKSSLKCIQCGENHPACLHFHHRDPSTKTIEVSIAVGSCWRMSKILEEIQKCDVLCANCHAKKHYAVVAQTVEQGSCKTQVGGATPALPLQDIRGVWRNAKPSSSNVSRILTRSILATDCMMYNYRGNPDLR